MFYLNSFNLALSISYLRSDTYSLFFQLVMTRISKQKFVLFLHGLGFLVCSSTFSWGDPRETNVKILNKKKSNKTI